MKEIIDRLQNLTMADLARVWRTTHNPGTRSSALYDTISDADQIDISPFTVPLLPGRIFVFVTAKLIAAVLHAVGIYASPTLIPREEWHGANTVPWDVSRCNIGRLLRIKGGSYRGGLGYVIGTSQHSETVILAVIPRISEKDLTTTSVKHKRPRLDHDDSYTPKTGTRGCIDRLF